MGQDETTSSPGLTADEAAAMERVRSVSHLLDEAVRIPGTDIRVGLDPFLSIVPIGGDLVGATISLYPVLEAVRLGVPKRTVALMLGLIAVDAVVGAIPVLGSVFDAVWKANEWNRRLLERHFEGA